MAENKKLNDDFDDAKARTDYAMRESEFDFDKDKEAIFEGLDDSLNSVRENPVNYVLGAWQKEFLRNERMSYELFEQLNLHLQELDEMLTSNHFYNNMDIVRLFLEILIRFKNWVTSMRQTVFLCRDKMIEMKRVVAENYVPNQSYEDLQQEYSTAIAEATSGTGLRLGGEEKDGTVTLKVPKEVLRQEGVKGGDWVYIKKYRSQK